jgi:serine/threonine protein kinase
MKSDFNNFDDRFNEALADYMQRLDRGEPVDRKAFLAEYADVADELCAYFDDADLVERMAGPRAADTLDSPGTRTAGVPPLGKIRYFGDYELLEEIARGGMGVVYKARQVSLNRIVAVKLILAGQLASEADVKRFHAEAEAAANLDHPGIVPIFEIGHYDGQHYISMGLVEGGRLDHLIRRLDLTPRQAAEYVQKVAIAVEFAHQRGVIHRDLKLANVLIDRFGEPKITDFGLAKQSDSSGGLTATGQVLGTPGYMAPEQAFGGYEVGPAADVFALGAVLYALLTGRCPFVADTPLNTLLETREKEPVSPRAIHPGIPRDLESITLMALSKRPMDRFASAKALAEDLGRFLNAEPIQARRISPVVRWSRANLGLRWQLGAPQAMTLLGLAAILIGMFHHQFSDNESSASTVLNGGIGLILSWAMLAISLFSAAHRYSLILIIAVITLPLFSALQRAVTERDQYLNLYDRSQLLWLFSGMAISVVGAGMGTIRQRDEGLVGPKHLWGGCVLLLLSCVVQAAFAAPVIGANSQWYAVMEIKHPLAGISLYTLLLAATFLAGFSGLRLPWAIVFVAIAAMVASEFSFDYRMHHPHRAHPLATITSGSLLALGSVGLVFWVSRSTWLRQVTLAGESKQERFIALCSYLSPLLLTLYEFDQLRYGGTNTVAEVMLRLTAVASILLAGIALLYRIKGRRPWDDISAASLALLLLFIINADLWLTEHRKWNRELAGLVLVLTVIIGFLRSQRIGARLVGGALSLCAATVVLLNPIYEYHDGWISDVRVLWCCGRRTPRELRVLRCCGC